MYTSNNVVGLILPRIHNDSVAGTPIRPLGASEEFRQDQACMGHVCWSYIALANGGRYQEGRPGCFGWHLDHNRKKWMGITGKYGPALKISELIISVGRVIRGRSGGRRPPRCSDGIYRRLYPCSCCPRIDSFTDGPSDPSDSASRTQSPTAFPPVSRSRRSQDDRCATSRATLPHNVPPRADPRRSFP